MGEGDATQAAAAASDGSGEEKQLAFWSALVHPTDVDAMDLLHVTCRGLRHHGPTGDDGE